MTIILLTCPQCNAITKIETLRNPDKTFKGYSPHGSTDEEPTFPHCPHCGKRLGGPTIQQL